MTGNKVCMGFVSMEDADRFIEKARAWDFGYGRVEWRRERKVVSNARVAVGKKRAQEGRAQEEDFSYE